MSLLLNERLIVAADFDPQKEGGSSGVRAKVLTLAENLTGLGVYIKVNSILRAAGFSLIKELHQSGLKVFADLKLIDIPNTLTNDAKFLAEFHPELVTVMACAGIEAMAALQENLGEKTQVLAVTVLTSLDEKECQEIFGCIPEIGVLRLALMAQKAGISNLILSPQEVAIVRQAPTIRHLILNTPGIRPVWSVVPGDDQSRVTTISQAIKAGADRIVVGRPILGAKPNNQGFPQSPREAVERTLQEIEQALK